MIIAKTSKDKAILASSCLGGLFDGFDAALYVLVLFPAISELIHSQSHAEVGPVGAAVLAIFMIGWAAGAIIFGAISDRIGTVRTMTYTILLYAVSTGLCAISHSWQELVFIAFWPAVALVASKEPEPFFLLKPLDPINRLNGILPLV